MASKNNSFLITAGILGLLVIALLAALLFDNLVVFWCGLAACIAFVAYILFAYHKRLQQYENQMPGGKPLLEALMQSMGDAAVVVGMDRNVLQLNPAAEKLLGWTDGDAFGRPLAEVVGEAEVSDPIQIASNMRDACHFDEPVVLRSAGRRFTVQSAVPLRDRNGKVYQVVLVLGGQNAATQPARTADSFEKKIPDAVQNNAERVCAFGDDIPGRQGV